MLGRRQNPQTLYFILVCIFDDLDILTAYELSFQPSMLV